ncbi:hypothetical protein XM38_029990 [Halomicronema hongdechloris C2206]|uniref:Uncharacterized protein n=1 Tax=Halomicronema hongdechloris C2206 TaxID=1641165 RepID=A0A1Z3HP32_9CYAN|nr:hypothetical protein [Halomicronema hongdechloris]ASC72045.1 hypothetical protein XM38_029990 [Halomicronema hongdechloris C2206]
MLEEHVSSDYSSQIPKHPRKAELDIPQAQQIIFDFLLTIVKSWPVEDVLNEFKHLFIQHTETASSETLPALYTIIFANNEEEFRNTLKRCCYILVNNWEVARDYFAIQQLVDLFDDPLLEKQTLSPTLRRLRTWLLAFKQSQDFQDLALFAARINADRHVKNPDEHWTARYTSYLLVPQYINAENPIEQREAARALSQRLKDQFKFELAMYTAHSQSSVPSSNAPQNPTVLGDGVLRLIKRIVAKQGQFSYKNLAHLFLEQVKQLTYQQFKKSLLQYLLYSINRKGTAKTIKRQLTHKLEDLYPEYADEEVDRSLILRTCNRVIDSLMTEDKKNPSQLFTLILSQGNSLTLVVLLLKLILISKNSHPYLEARIADLIRYYEQFPQEQCQWVINFLEIFRVTFAIYAENVEYNLVRMAAQTVGYQSDQDEDGAAPSRRADAETVRIFSRLLYQTDALDESLLSVESSESEEELDLDEAAAWLDERLFDESFDESFDDSLLDGDIDIEEEGR